MAPHCCQFPRALTNPLVSLKPAHGPRNMSSLEFLYSVTGVGFCFPTLQVISNLLFVLPPLSLRLFMVQPTDHLLSESLQVFAKNANSWGPSQPLPSQKLWGSPWRSGHLHVERLPKARGLTEAEEQDEAPVLEAAGTRMCLRWAAASQSPLLEPVSIL